MNRLLIWSKWIQPVKFHKILAIHFIFSFFKTISTIGLQLGRKSLGKQILLRELLREVSSIDIDSFSFHGRKKKVSVSQYALMLHESFTAARMFPGVTVNKRTGNNSF